MWLANHQMPDGRWSFQAYADRCTDKTCTGPGTVQADAGATALGLLPFLAAGQTHKTKGPYRRNIANAVNWLIRNQEPNGNLAKDCPQPMYSHGLATIALSEAYGLSGDRNIGIAAQGAANYVINAQNKNDGGWRYNPGDAGDTSVLGWQVMALKSAQMAGLSVPDKTFKGAKKWLDAVASGPNGSRYSYQPGGAASVTMTAVGLLARQHLGTKRSDPTMTDGARYLMGHLPDPAQPNLYYWFPATVTMHNVSGTDWEAWHRQVRRVLVETQDRDFNSCANGSWAPQKDLWGQRGGRLMTTSLAALTLEVHYRYLPLYKANEEVGPQPNPPRAKKSILRVLGEMLRASPQSPLGEAEPSPAADTTGEPATETGAPDPATRAPRIGGTKHQERPVTGALVWLARHQMPDGRWNFQKYTDRCTDKTCTGPGAVQADAGATALALLPFLAAGLTHKTKGPYRGNIANGLNWLIRNQEPNGNLAKGCIQPMYSHGLATIALCEAYGMSGDRNVGMAAQGAVNYIINAQNKNDGGWRYNPGDPGDTSVLGWQLMALKSAQMAGLGVGGSTFGAAGKWLDAVASGPNGSRYSYQPGQAATVTMTAVGLLARQHLGVKRTDPMMIDGARYLMGHLPDSAQPNLYYWFPATMAMHNVNGTDWDTWWRQVRRVLVGSQERDPDSCANGSWAPQKDLWGRQGGRLMTTCLATLILEVYYRYLPLYKACEEIVPQPNPPQADQSKNPKSKI